MLTIKPAQLNFNQQGIPFSSDYKDNYFSLSGAIEESQFVFIRGNQLEKRWKNQNFTIAELGFGFGINFITTCNLWIKQHTNQHRLHYISFEKHPIKKEDIEKCYKHLGAKSEFTAELIKQYPLLVRGSHRIHFQKHNILLTLVFEDALQALSDLSFNADAWYLDGFAPSKNSDMWSIEIAQEVFRLTKQDGTFATYSSASLVQKNFNSAGFTISKQHGFDKKREMLTGKCIHKYEKTKFQYKDKSWLHNSISSPKNRNAVIIGAGLTGFCVAGALAKRDWNVTIIDKHENPAMEGSGNRNAILMPRLSVNHDIQSRLTLTGFLYSINFLDDLEKQATNLVWEQCGAIQIPRDFTQRQRMQQIISQENILPELIQPITKQKVQQLTGCVTSDDGWYIPLAGWTVPKQICITLQELFKDKINFISNTEVTLIKQHEKIWSLLDNNDNKLFESETVIIANANAADQFTQTNWCKTHPKRGQITCIPKSESNIHPTKIICSDAYITPEIDNHYVFGATFITADTSTDVRSIEHQDNINKIKKIIPAFKYENVQRAKGRASIRAVSPDRLPIVGPVAKQINFYDQYREAALGASHIYYSSPNYYDGLYIATGFGSRGLAWIPLCAELLACTITDEPSPIGLSLSNAIHPNRILMKNLQTKINSHNYEIN